MTLGEFLRVVGRRWRIGVAFAVLGMLVTSVIAIVMPPSYEAKVDIFFTASDPTANVAERVAGYAPLVTNDFVTSSVVGQLGIDQSPEQFARRITVTTQANSAVLTVGVQLSDPTQTSSAANAVATSFTQLFGRLNGPQAPNTPPPVTATVVQPAGVPVAATWPSVLTFVIGVVVSVALGVAVAAWRGRADPKVRTTDDVAALTRRPVLGEITSSASGVEFRRVRTMLRSAAGDRAPRIVAVCSASAGDANGLVGLNLAVALAHAGSRVLLVEADLQHPRISHHVGLDTRTGITTVLSGSKPLGEAVRPCTVAGLSVLSAGIVDADSVDLLGSARMTELLERARAEYDVVVLDTAPLLGDPSAADLASRTDGAVLVAGRWSTRKEELRASVRLLDQVGAPLLGTVVRAPGRAASDDDGPWVAAAPTPRVAQTGPPTPPPFTAPRPPNGPVRTGPPSDPTPTQTVVPVQQSGREETIREESGTPSDTTAEFSARYKSWIPLAPAGAREEAPAATTPLNAKPPNGRDTDGMAAAAGKADDTASTADKSNADGKAAEASGKADTDADDGDTPETSRGDSAAKATTESGSTA